MKILKIEPGKSVQIMVGASVVSDETVDNEPVAVIMSVTVKDIERYAQALAFMDANGWSCIEEEDFSPSWVRCEDEWGQWNEENVKMTEEGVVTLDCCYTSLWRGVNEQQSGFIEPSCYVKNSDIKIIGKSVELAQIISLLQQQADDGVD